MVASSNLIRWGLVAATAGGVLFSVVDPAVVGTFAGQQTLRVLGTVVLSGGLIVFVTGFVGAGFLRGLDRERRVAALASIALGSYCLLALPIYYLVFTDTVRVFGGESPLCLLLSLVVVPFLLRNSSSGALLAATLIKRVWRAHPGARGVLRPRSASRWPDDRVLRSGPLRASVRAGGRLHPHHVWPRPRFVPLLSDTVLVRHSDLWPSGLPDRFSVIRG